MKRFFLILLLAVLLVLSVGAEEAVPGEDMPTEGIYTDESLDAPGENEASDSSATQNEPSVDEIVDVPTEDEDTEDEDTEDEDGGLSYSEVEAFVYDKIVPYAVLAISAMFTIYLLIAPILKKVMDASEKFKSATSGVTKANDDNDKTQQENAALLEQMKEERRAIAAAQAAFEERVGVMMQGLTNEVKEQLGTAGVKMSEIHDMVHIGFCNDANMVKRGVARKIARIAQGSKMEIEQPTTGEDLSGENREEVGEDGSNDGQFCNAEQDEESADA